MDHPYNFLKSARFEFDRYKTLGERTFAQLSLEQLHWRKAENENSIMIIAKHLVGNMLSRWTNFLIEDGEKPWRHRETEFEAPYTTREELLEAWETGWACLFEALEGITVENFDVHVAIRSETHTITAAVHRQLAHYAYHIGQIVFLGKSMKGKDWVSLSIPKGGSEAFNKEKRSP